MVSEEKDEGGNTQVPLWKRRRRDKPGRMQNLNDLARIKPLGVLGRFTYPGADI